MSISSDGISPAFSTEIRTDCSSPSTLEYSKRLAEQLQALRANAASFLSVAAAETEAEAPPGDDAADQRLLAEMSRLLHERNLAALDLFNVSSAPLRRLLGKQSFEALRDRIDKLQFEDAVSMLESAARQ